MTILPACFRLNYMDTILEGLATETPARGPILFTSQNAAAMAKKSAEVRRKLGEERKRKLQELYTSPLPSQIPQPKEPEPAFAEDIREELELVEEQITRTREVLNDKTPYCPACERCALEPQHRAQLLKALDTLLNRKRILQGRPTPGSLKPSQAKPRRSAEIVPEA